MSRGHHFAHTSNLWTFFVQDSAGRGPDYSVTTTKRTLFRDVTRELSHVATDRGSLSSSSGSRCGRSRITIRPCVCTKVGRLKGRHPKGHTCLSTDWMIRGQVVSESRTALLLSSEELDRLSSWFRLNRLDMLYLLRNEGVPSFRLCASLFFVFFQKNGKTS